jgi:hypothetical protein
MKIKLPPADLSKPHITRDYLNAIMADQIRSQYKSWFPSTWKKEMPKRLYYFVNQFDEDAGYYWEQDLMVRLCDEEKVSIETLESWVNVLRQSFLRAELRAELKRRMTIDNPT